MEMQAYGRALALAWTVAVKDRPDLPRHLTGLMQLPPEHCSGAQQSDDVWQLPQPVLVHA
jgi:hypothetical protein